MLDGNPVQVTRYDHYLVVDETLVSERGNRQLAEPVLLF